MRLTVPPESHRLEWWDSRLGGTAGSASGIRSDRGRDGRLAGSARVLAPHTVELMTTNQSGALHSATGLGYGFGFETVDRYGASGMNSVGTFKWAGAYGSTYFVDPKERLVAVFMINQLPTRTDVASRFPTLVYQALVGSAVTGNLSIQER
jgi:CubicO group peptidase (beta-lactamase class C family)